MAILRHLLLPTRPHPPLSTCCFRASPVLLRGAMDSRASSSSKTARAAKSKDKGKAVVEAIPLSQMMGDENRSFISQYRAHPSPTRGAAVAAPWSCTRFSGSSSSRALGNNVGDSTPRTQPEPRNPLPLGLLQLRHLQLQRDQALLQASSYLLNNSAKRAREEETRPLTHTAATVPAPALGMLADTAHGLITTEEQDYTYRRMNQLKQHQLPAPSVRGNSVNGQNISQAAVFAGNPQNEVCSEPSAGVPPPPSPRPHSQAQEVEEREWILILHKVLQKTDVGGLHRIILPKRDAEANLPRLENVGTVLEMLDMAYHITWKFKYRFWPGSKSRVYVLENTEKFVKKHKLEAGDRIGIYRKETSKHYLIGVLKNGSGRLATGSDDDTDLSSENDKPEAPPPCQKRKLTINLGCNK